MRLLAFPNDPLEVYLSKGEIKKLYFNPGNVFKEIILISPGSETIDVSRLRYATGDAVVKVISWGHLSFIEQIIPHLRLRKLKKIIFGLDVDVVRGFSPFYSGFYAVQSARFLNVKCLISIHSNFIELKSFYFQDLQFLRFAKYFFLAQTIEKFTLKNADLLQPAYDYAAQYCLNKGGQKIRQITVYNRVYKNEFFPNLDFVHKKPDLTQGLKIIAVGNLDFRKGQQTLVRAMDKIDGNCTLTLVGQGKDEMNILSIIRD